MAAILSRPQCVKNQTFSTHHKYYQVSGHQGLRNWAEMLPETSKQRHNPSTSRKQDAFSITCDVISQDLAKSRSRPCKVSKLPVKFLNNQKTLGTNLHQSQGFETTLDVMKSSYICDIETAPKMPHQSTVDLWYQQISRAGTSNYIPQYLWDVITCPCPRYFWHTSPQFIKV